MRILADVQGWIERKNRSGAQQHGERAKRNDWQGRLADQLCPSNQTGHQHPEQRRQALVLHESLLRIQGMTEAGERSAANLIAAGRQAFDRESSVRLDYLEIVDPNTLDPVSDLSGGALVAVAAWVGATRLIDNIVLPSIRR